METVLNVQSINKHYPGFLWKISAFLLHLTYYGLIGKMEREKYNFKAILNMVSQKAGASPCFTRISISMKKSASNA